MSAKVGASVHELRKKLKPTVAESWFHCPTKVGLHISVGKVKSDETFFVHLLNCCNNSTLLGKELNFNWKR
jgi:hypothetical protein